jgi:hypothetical protein
VLGKRPSSPVKIASVKKAPVSLKKRDVKEETKNIDDGDLRKSKRQSLNPKPIYDEKEIDKIILGDATGASVKGGSINVMLA